MDYITKKLSGCPGSTIAKDLKDVVRFLDWKRTERPECFTEIEHSLMEEQKRNLSRLVYLSSNCYSYDRSLTAKYSEILWQESINNTLSLEGKANIPKVSCEPLPIPPDFSRLDEVLYMSLFYENNTMYHFLWQRSLVESPLCRCMEGKWSLGLMPFGLKSFGLIQLVTWLNIFKLSVSGIGHLA